MTFVEAPIPPATALDPASFFANPPSSPSALADSRLSLMADGTVADKFHLASLQAQSGGDPSLAAAASWVSGQYSSVLELAPDQGELMLYIRGSSLLELGRYEEAATTLADACQAADPLLAALALHAFDAADQTKTLQKSLSKAKISAADKAYFAARLQERNGFYEEACAVYEEILSDDPSHFFARFHLALRADLHGDDAEAQRHYEALLERRPIATSVLLNLGILYEDANDFQRACGCFGAILRRDPNHPAAKLFFRDSHESLDMFYDEDLERRGDRLMQVLRTPISDFELSVRARNCLANMDIRTLSDLVSHSEKELLEFKNFGETSLNEIKRVLTAKGLRPDMRLEDGSFVIPDEFDADSCFDPERDLAWLGPITDDQREALDLQISTLNLSVRCHRALVERLSLQRIGDILRFTEEDLLSMPNFGITSLNELSAKLTEMNLHLRSGRGEEYGDVAPDSEEPPYPE